MPNGADELKKISIPFSYSKSPELIARLIEMANVKDYDTVLDFFSGSATTAHAVMSLNASDSGHRQFILIQLPDPTPPNSEARKAGFPTICAIGEERIRRAGKKLREDFPSIAGEIDTGFRLFRVDSTNMRDVYKYPEELRQDELMRYVDNIKDDRTPEDLLIQVMLKLGINLSVKIEEKIVAGKRIFSVDEGYMVACFDEKVNDETVEVMARMRPYYAYFRDSGMENDNVIINFQQIFNAYSPRTRLMIL